MVVLVFVACGDAGGGGSAVRPDVEWPYYGGDSGGGKHSPLTDINRHNVADLNPVWMIRTGDSTVAADYVHLARFEATPIMVSGVLYVSTPRNRVLALDPATGNLLWSFDPQIDVTQAFSENLTSRGVSAWSDNLAAPNSRCARRIFLTTVDARLIALDAVDGGTCETFGTSGSIPLDVGVGLSQAFAGPGHYSVTSPPAVVGSVVIVGSAVSGSRHQGAPSGMVRAFDARTGEIRWTFDAVPRSRESDVWERWSPAAASTTGGANVWSIISVDAERDLVFLPTSSAAPNFFGGNRVGRNDYANSVVALTASTGEHVWSFQVVHHDLWDYDVAAQPLLIDIVMEDRVIPAVVVGTKMGTIFILDRASGEPLLPVEERLVPPSDVPGESAWPTQPFPVSLKPLAGTTLTPDSAFGVSAEEIAFCRELIGRLRNEGIYTPPSMEGSLIWPGYWGGITWSGMAWDPRRQLIVTTMNRMAMVVQLHRTSDVIRLPGDQHPGAELIGQYGTPYIALRMPLVAPSGMPCSPPPWGVIVAVDVAKGLIRWQRPLGIAPAAENFARSDTWGSLVFGGPLVTDGGLIFVGASQDDQFRAFDIDTGALLWEHRLPAGGQAAPMTYLYEGRQYVVIAAGGRSGIGSRGDWVVAFALR